MTFTPNGDGTFTMRTERGHTHQVRPYKTRQGKRATICRLCWKAIRVGATAYHETGTAQERHFLSTVRLCGRCVTGAAQ